MSINHVVIGGEVKLDLRNDTVTSDVMLYGKVAHDKRGEKVIGNYIPPAITISNHTVKLSPAFVVGHMVCIPKFEYPFSNESMSNNLLETGELKEVIYQ